VLALNFVVTRITGGRERANGAGRQLLRRLRSGWND
jgi:hypothetical protein